jgi:hypothetical protein
MTDIVVYIINIFNENDSEYEEETAYCIFHFKKLFASILVLNLYCAVDSWYCKLN